LAGFQADAWLLPLLVMLAMTYHLWRYERHRAQAATDFLASLGGVFYIGLLGSFFLLIRALPNGPWWLMATLFGIWLADSGAYLIGIRWGRRALAPRLSPKKTWEGYLGGILSAVVFLPLFFLLFYRFGLSPQSGLTLARAAVLAGVLGIFPTLGDLGESMFKRQVGLKDSGHLLPGHGGMFDRVDSWLWGAVLGYFTIAWFFL
jgi:phosphatidate cytidylyltransferase